MRLHKGKGGPKKLGLLFVPMFLLVQLVSLATVVGQGSPTSIIGLEFDDELVDIDALDEPWTDPIILFDLQAEPLASISDYDISELHPSTVFAPGVENVSVQGDIEIEIETEQHLRAVQAVATANDALNTANVNITTAEGSIATAQGAITIAENQISSLDGEIAVLRDEVAELTNADNIEIAAQTLLNSEIDAHQEAITEIAIQAFIGADDALESVMLDPFSSEPFERRVVANEVRETQRADILARELLVSESNDRRDVLATQLGGVRAEIAHREASIASLEEDIDQRQGQIRELRNDILNLDDRTVVLAATIEEATAFSELTAARYQIAYHERLELFVAGTDLPLVALNAYVRASNTLAGEDPGCGIHWSQLAGIGRIESFHGYFGNSSLDVNGQTTDLILGIALDGRVLSGPTSGDVPDATNRTEQTGLVSRLALIRDTDGGRLDGDTVYDRAVGPMQFIPSTWRLYDTDGNGDGVRDPQNMYDASLASARYLCNAPGSMLTAEGEQRAYFAYNHDLAYSQNVTVAGRGYHEDIRISPDPSPSFASYAASGAAEALARQAIEEAIADASEEVDGEEEDPDEGQVGDELPTDPTEPIADEPVDEVETDVLGETIENDS